jgi:hypothetical protein
VNQKWHLSLLSEGILTVYKCAVKLPVFMIFHNYERWGLQQIFNVHVHKQQQVEQNKALLQDHEARGTQIPSTRLQWLLNFIW